MATSAQDHAALLHRLDAFDQIRHLAAKYALAADMRDLDAIVTLYVEDVATRAGAVGREKLKEQFFASLKLFDSTIHFVGNHVIELTGPDSAQGVVYCTAHHEMGAEWIVAQLIYHDEYARRDGRWLFVSRAPIIGFATPVAEAPTGPDKIRFPGRPAQPGLMHAYSPAWAEFDRDGEAGPLVEGQWSFDQFLSRVRRGAAVPTAQVPR